MNEQSLKERLKVIAQQENRTFQDVWKSLVLERFLVRISKSNQNENFIFKGGMLLSHYLNIGRETKDLDFLISRMKTEIDNIKKAFQDVCSVNVNDGFLFTFSGIELLDQPHMKYPGYRVNLDLNLISAFPFY